MTLALRLFVLSLIFSSFSFAEKLPKYILRVDGVTFCLLVDEKANGNERFQLFDVAHGRQLPIDLAPSSYTRFKNIAVINVAHFGSFLVSKNDDGTVSAKLQKLNEETASDIAAVEATPDELKKIGLDPRGYPMSPSPAKPQPTIGYEERAHQLKFEPGGRVKIEHAFHGLNGDAFFFFTEHSYFGYENNGRSLFWQPAGSNTLFHLPFAESSPREAYGTKAKEFHFQTPSAANKKLIAKLVVAEDGTATLSLPGAEGPMAYQPMGEEHQSKILQGLRDGEIKALVSVTQRGNAHLFEVEGSAEPLYLYMDGSIFHSDSDGIEVFSGRPGKWTKHKIVPSNFEGMGWNISLEEGVVHISYDKQSSDYGYGWAPTAEADWNGRKMVEIEANSEVLRLFGIDLKRFDNHILVNPCELLLEGL